MDCFNINITLIDLTIVLQQMQELLTSHLMPSLCIYHMQLSVWKKKVITFLGK